MSCTTDHTKMETKFCPECGVEIIKQQLTDEEHILNVMNTMYEKFVKMTERNHKDECELLGESNSYLISIDKHQLYIDFVNLLNRNEFNKSDSTSDIMSDSTSDIIVNIVLVNGRLESYDTYLKNMKKLLSDHGCNVDNLKLNTEENSFKMIFNNKIYNIKIYYDLQTIKYYADLNARDVLKDKLVSKYKFHYSSYGGLTRDMESLFNYLIRNNNNELNKDIAEAILILNQDI